MITVTKISAMSAKTPVQPQQLDNIELSESQRAYFFQEVIEGLQDGILLLNETGELIYANTSALSIFSQINQDSSSSNFIPPAIWRLCKTLLENRSLLPNKAIILSNEIVVDRSKIFRVRARWLNLERFNRSYLLVIIENRYESLKNIALAEVKKYELTPREAEIWCLYRAKFSYKEIAAQLYITLNTVKKHMRNIHTKRQAFLSCED
ncbi:MAG: helix-turn-helix transcriptional regulator [Iphinoe sp. HA4291-MV1]|jgi:DNA-binding CsgD family transcriptional regulator|nr:helix-turn-helix transcriptional regulator [Iphinoe sp. HA4291-MV1]